MSDPNHKGFDRFLEWWGDSFNTESFDLEEMNRSLHQPD